MRLEILLSAVIFFGGTFFSGYALRRLLKLKNEGFLFSIAAVDNNINMANFAHMLYEDYNIECRYGFHCSFLAHNFYKNDNGALRFSFSPYTTKEDLEYLINILGK